ncbi:hypothetical protein [Streptomyces canus]|uniref:hypothetical protein n=1 Tax=Streptomyces canus TaxID=58343 RepID=UPI00216B2EBD|nr:hypothetical protein [Streptomyces canus]
MRGVSASPAVRSLRAAVFAALCVLLAAGGHALATGTALPVWVQAAGFVPVFGAGYLLGRRERSLAAIGIGTLTAQGALHLAYGAARPHATMGMQGMRMSHAHALTPHATAAHVVVALVLTWWLVSGGVRLVPDVRDVVGPRRWADGPRLLRGLLLRHAVQRRGPPGSAFPI